MMMVVVMLKMMKIIICVLSMADSCSRIHTQGIYLFTYLVIICFFVCLKRRLFN